ncbi:MAG: hypothetical protein AMJ66_09560 [Betaproteobacteria bacterium SG8_40]|nr:MAG: hypothetical protein AMJ66_09560 [Betaproteobacteria bacterium SG8_40]
MKQTDFIDIPLRASHRLAWLLAATHCAAIAAVLALPVSWWLRVAACALVLTSAVFQIHRRALRNGDHAFVGLRLMRNGSCQLRTAGGGVIGGRLCRGWFVSPQLVVIRISCDGERWSRGISLLPDSADPDDLRRLRVFLRFAVGPSARS